MSSKIPFGLGANFGGNPTSSANWAAGRKSVTSEGKRVSNACVYKELRDRATQNGLKRLLAHGKQSSACLECFGDLLASVSNIDKI